MEIGERTSRLSPPLFHSQKGVLNGQNLSARTVASKESGEVWRHNESRTKIREARKRQTFSIETRRKISLSLLGNTRRRGIPNSPEERERIRKWHLGKKYSAERRKNISESLKGDKHPNWQGGIYPRHKAIRKSAKYREWRDKVFTRDKWTCQECGQRGGELQADHIKPFSDYPELRFDINNGRTLCKGCHRKTPTWGKH